MNRVKFWGEFALRPKPPSRTTLAIAAAAFLACGACGHRGSPEGGQAAAATRDSIQIDKASPRMQFLKVETLDESDVGGTVALTGRVTFDEDHTQRVSSPLDGRATQLLVKLGDKVRVGQSLITLSSPQVGQLQADAQKAQQDMMIAQRTVERARKLKVDGAVSEKDMAQAEADLHKATTEAARATSHLASLGVSAADPTVGASVSARVAGTVVERNVLVGQEIRADAPAPLLTISNLDTVWVMADVYEQDLALVQPGAKVGVRVPAYPNEVFPGTIEHMGDVVDPTSRTVKLRCSVPNPGQRLKPEMFAKVELTSAAGGKVLAIPSRAVLNDSEHSRVVTVDNDNVFSMRIVEVGPENGGKVRVLSGLKPGEKIVTEGALFVKNEIDNR
jgi:cobalt-zinc-cadmium efflux system membrane fusion protein